MIPAIILLGKYPKEMKILTGKGIWDFPGGAVVKNPPANVGDTVQSLVWGSPSYCRATKPVHLKY